MYSVVFVILYSLSFGYIVLSNCLLLLYAKPISYIQNKDKKKKKKQLMTDKKF